MANRCSACPRAAARGCQGAEQKNTNFRRAQLLIPVSTASRAQYIFPRAPPKPSPFGQYTGGSSFSDAMTRSMDGEALCRPAIRELSPLRKTSYTPGVLEATGAHGCVGAFLLYRTAPSPVRAVRLFDPPCRDRNPADRFRGHGHADFYHAPVFCHHPAAPIILRYRARAVSGKYRRYR